MEFKIMFSARGKDIENNFVPALRSRARFLTTTRLAHRKALQQKPRVRKFCCKAICMGSKSKGHICSELFIANKQLKINTEGKTAYSVPFLMSLSETKRHPWSKVVGKACLSALNGQETVNKIKDC